MIAALLLRLCCLVGLPTSVLCADFANPIAVNIETYIKEIIACQQIPALSLVILKLAPTGQNPDEDVIFERAIGIKKAPVAIGNKAPTLQQVDSRTPFCLGHVTSTMTSLLAAKLVEASKIQLNSRVSSILNTKMFQDSHLNDMATVADLLSHRTGINPFENFIASGPNLQDGTDLIKFLSHIKPNDNSLDDFRTSFRYNQLMISLAGVVLETAMNNSWEDMIRTELHDKLELQEATFLRHLDKDFAYPHVYGENRMTPLDETFLQTDKSALDPANSLCISTNDARKWLRFMLRKGSSESSECILSSETFESMMKPHISVKPPLSHYMKPGSATEFVRDAFGLGWFLGNFDGRTVYSHQGYFRGYQSAIWLFPDLNVGLYAAVSGSITSDLPDRMLMFIASLLLNAPPVETRQSICNLALVSRQQTAQPCACESLNSSSPIASQLIGQYHHANFGALNLSSNGDYVDVRFGEFGEAELCQHQQKELRFGLKFKGLLAHRYGHNFCPELSSDGSSSDSFLATDSTKEKEKFSSIRFSFYEPHFPPRFFRRDFEPGEKPSSIGPKTGSADCNNKLDAIIDTLEAEVKCGKNPFPEFIPKRCRVFKRDSKGNPTKTVKAALNAGEKSMLRNRRCEYSKEEGSESGVLRFLRDSSSSEKASFKFSVCAGRTEAGWFDKDGYGVYCEKSLYPPVIPVSCNFGGTLGVVAAGSQDSDSVARAKCFYDFKDASVTPSWAPMDFGPKPYDGPHVSSTGGMFSDVPWHI